MERTKDKKGNEDTMNIILFYKLFDLAGNLDITLMSIGTIVAIANGLAILVMVVLFRNLLNAF